MAECVHAPNERDLLAGIFRVIKPALVDAYTRQSAEVLDWLTRQYGIRFELVEGLAPGRHELSLLSPTRRSSPTRSWPIRGWSRRPASRRVPSRRPRERS